MAQTTRPHVVILGGGFAGLYCVRALDRADVRITLVDRRNHHLFQPLLYQVASAVLNPSEIAQPLRSVFGHRDDLDVVLAEAVSVDPRAKIVHLRDGQLSYDYLVIATGAVDAFFGHPEWEERTVGLKSIEEALEIRRRILFAFEAAEREQDPERQREWMTFVLIGGGPTGVEMAGALAEIARITIAHDFHHIDPKSARIVLIEGLPRVLPAYPDALSESARRTLERKGVEVRTGAKVSRIDPDAVWVGEERIATRTLIWSAGVAAAPIGATLGVPLGKGGRVQVQPDLTVPGHPEIFVAGDMVSLEQNGKPVPGVAPAAIQMGKHVAKNLRRVLKGEPPLPFHYLDKGLFSVIGRNAAVGTVFGRWQVKGFIAWASWLFIHLLYLVGFRNRFLVFSNWAYSYLSKRRGARLITAESRVEVDRPLVLLPENVVPDGDAPPATQAPQDAHAPVTH